MPVVTGRSGERVGEAVGEQVGLLMIDSSPLRERETASCGHEIAWPFRILLFASRLTTCERMGW